MPNLSLPAICDRSAARAMHTDLCDALGQDRVEIDAGSVEKIGMAMLQVLLSAGRSEAGIQIDNPSQAFHEVAELTGLASHFNEGDRT